MRALAARCLAVLVVAAAARAGAAEDLVVWNPNAFRELSGFRKMAEVYNARKGAAAPRVRVEALSFDGFADRVGGAVPRGKGPDLVVYPQDRLGGWVEAGNVVAPVDPYVDDEVRRRFIPVTLQAMRARGALYGLPLTYKPLTLFYDRALVRTPPRSTAELEAVARGLTDRAAGRYGLAYRYDIFYYHAALQNGFGGGVLDPLGRPVLDSPANARAMELLLRWKEAFLPDEEPTRESIRALFNERRAAMVIEGPWFLGEIAPAVDYGIVPLPALSEAHDQPLRPWLTVDGLYLAMPRDPSLVGASVRKAAAYDFMRFATSVEAARILALDGGEMPANEDVYAEPAIAQDPRLQVFFRAARVAVPMPNAPEMTAIWSPATVALARVLRRLETPQAALAKAQREVEQALARRRR